MVRAGGVLGWGVCAVSGRILNGDALRTAVVAKWNRGRWTMSEIGETFGRPRTTIGRILHDARRLGMFVLNIDAGEGSRRRHRTLCKNPAALEAYRAKQSANMKAVWAARRAALNHV